MHLFSSVCEQTCHLDCFMQPSSKSTQTVLVPGEQKEKIRCKRAVGGTCSGNAAFPPILTHPSAWVKEMKGCA